MHACSFTGNKKPGSYPIRTRVSLCHSRTLIPWINCHGYSFLQTLQHNVLFQEESKQVDYFGEESSCLQHKDIHQLDTGHLRNRLLNIEEI